MDNIPLASNDIDLLLETKSNIWDRYKKYRDSQT